MQSIIKNINGKLVLIKFNKNDINILDELLQKIDEIGDLAMDICYEVKNFIYLLG